MVNNSFGKEDDFDFRNTSGGNHMWYIQGKYNKDGAKQVWAALQAVDAADWQCDV